MIELKPNTSGFLATLAQMLAAYFLRFILNVSIEPRSVEEDIVPMDSSAAKNL